VANLIENKKASLNYEIMETLEAGIELLGFEVKSLKSKLGSLDGSYVVVRGGEAFMINSFVPPYQEKNTSPDYEPRRHRRLIVSKEEIRKLAGIEGKGGLTIVPLSIYNKGNLLKVSLAVVRGKNKFDKRETLKKRETERATRREFRDR